MFKVLTGRSYIRFLNVVILIVMPGSLIREQRLRETQQENEYIFTGHSGRVTNECDDQVSVLMKSDQLVRREHPGRKQNTDQTQTHNSQTRQ